MRHFLSTRAIARLTGGMAKPTPAALLIEAAGVPERPSPRGARAGGRAVPLCAVAHPAEEELASTVEPTADDQPQRIHAPPRSGRGGWTTTVRRAKKGAASRALPRCDSARGSGVAKTPDPHPSAPSAGTLYLNSPRLGNSRPTAGPVANSAFSGDGQHDALVAAATTNGSSPATAKAGHEQTRTTDETNPWDAAQTISEYLAGSDQGGDFIDPERRLLCRGLVTETFSPRGIGKSIIMLAFVDRFIRAGVRVLLQPRQSEERCHEAAARLRDD
jgi:hypothetical protein